MANLNLGDFTTVINDDFTKDKSLNTSIWAEHWGNPNQYWFTGTSAGLLLSGSAAAGWNPVGIEQLNISKSGGEGYGLYSFTGYAGQAGQGVGICFLLWPSDNVWLPSNKPYQASEMDILESWDGTKNGYSTLHYYQPGSNNNGQEIHQISNIDLTKSHTYALNWEAGSLTYYVDGVQIYQDTTHVPLDYAHGGVNETMGAEVVNEASYQTTSTVQLYIQDISYSKQNTGAPTAPVKAAPTITLSSPGTVQEASVGAGVTVTETVTATGLTSVYEEVLTKTGAVETGYQAVALNSSGSASFSVHLAASGDTIRAVDSSTAPTVTANSAAVTITDPVVATPTPTITLSSPGTVQEASVGAGVTVTETVTATGLTSVYEEVLTKTGAVETGYQAVALNSSGSASFSVHLAASGDTIRAVDSSTAPTVTANSAAVTITDPVVATPTPTPSPTMAFILSNVVHTSATQDTITVSKATGVNQTIRAYVDGTYKGVLWDNAPDGKPLQGFTINDSILTVGSHVLKLTLDNSSLSTSYDYDKTTGGSITHVTTAAAASAGQLLLTHVQ